MHLSSFLLLTGPLLVGSPTVYAKESNSSRQNGGYELKQPPLTTGWTDKVGTEPWQDYPRPQMQRPKWQNLNGVWRYQKANGTDDVDDPPFGETLPHAVLVPSCLESGLSGVLPSFQIAQWICANKYKELWNPTLSTRGLRQTSLSQSHGLINRFSSTSTPSTMKQLCSSTRRKWVFIGVDISISQWM